MPLQSVLITDTNIWIDLENGSILTRVFELPYRFLVPDLAIPELHRPGWQTLRSLGVMPHELKPELVQKLSDLRSSNHSLSVTDLAAFIIAAEHNFTLLTGDRRLTELAKKSKVPVHGIIWLLDELVRFRTLNSRQAADALNLMLNGGARLPKDEYQKRLAKWAAEGK